MDLTDQYNTELGPEEEAFQQWLASRGRTGDLYDYDLRGFYKNTPPDQRDIRDANGNIREDIHFPDTYKKPNHPTFSNESQYHNGKELEGGSWMRSADGKWEFRPGRTNMEHYSPQDLQSYFEQSEPESRLVFEGM